MPHLQAEQPKQAPVLTSQQGSTGKPSSAASSQEPAKTRTGKDNYPVIGQLEVITFGSDRAQLPVEKRLSGLEQAIYHQIFPALSLAERSKKLKDTLLGPATEPELRPAPVDTKWPPVEPANLPLSMPTQAGGSRQIDPALLNTWKQPFFQISISRQEADHFALSLVNEQRAELGLAALQWDDLCQKVASTLVDDLLKRDTVSHLNLEGENPDVRYTKAGGADALSESLATVSGPYAGRINRELVARVIEEMKSHQDDRDSLFSPDATHFAFSVGSAGGKDKAIACAEVVTRHAVMHPIPEALKLGDKLEIKGVLKEPYKFEKVTLAWEGSIPGSQPGQASRMDEPQDEAMPYFPPLDYVAYAEKAEHDREKLMAVLRTTGVVAALAGGLFMPPVALAAPLIAMAPVSDEPKAAADVPVHRGIKVHGLTFSGIIPVNHQNKEGLYYLTIWAATGNPGHPVPVSRRTVIVGARESKMPMPSRDTGTSANQFVGHALDNAK